MQRIKVTEKVLASGLTVIHLQTGPSCLFEASIHFGVGSGSETPELNGLSHLLEHMMFRGSGPYFDSLEFSKRLESICGETNAFTSAETTEYWFQCGRQYSEEMMRLLCFFLNDPLFTQFEVEKRIIFQEIDEDYNENGLLIDDHSLAMRAHFGANGLGLPIGGTREGLAKITLDDVNEHRLKCYHPSGSILTLQSSHEPEEILAMCEKLLAPWKGTAQANGIQNNPQLPLSHKKETRVPVNNSDNQFTLRISFALPIRQESSSKNSFAELQPFEILERILDDGTASQLQSSIRETLGLVYTISAALNIYREVLTFDIEATVCPEHLLETHDQILHLLRQAQISGPSLEELERAKVRACFDVEKLNENHRDYLQRLVDARFQSADFDLEERKRFFEAMSIADVCAAAKTLFRSENLALVLVGPDAKNWIGKLQPLC